MYLSDSQQKALLALARATLEREIAGRIDAEVPEIPSELSEKMRGAFVTLHRSDGSLRGCIGHITPTMPLSSLVPHLSLQSALRDPRFASVRPEEVDGLVLEISVLTEPRVIADPSEVEVGRHGLIVSDGLRRGLLLPQVAEEMQWEREMFLERTCVKAGLDPDAWLDDWASLKVEVFEAQVFGE